MLGSGYRDSRKRDDGDGRRMDLEWGKDGPEGSQGTSGEYVNGRVAPGPSSG